MRVPYPTLEMLVFVEEGKPENQLQEKALEQGENQWQTQPKNGTKLEPKTGHMGGGEHSQDCTIPYPLT